MALRRDELERFKWNSLEGTSFHLPLLSFLLPLSPLFSLRPPPNSSPLFSTFSPFPPLPSSSLLISSVDDNGVVVRMDGGPSPCRVTYSAEAP